MKVSRSVLWLGLLIIVLSSIAAGVGLFWQGGEGAFISETLRGQSVEIYGRGLYAFETAFRAPILRGADAIILFIGIPAFTVALLLYRSGSLHGGILMTGLLSCFLYDYASLAFSAAYNPFFLVYLILFSASLFAFVLMFLSIDVDELADRISPRFPHRGISVFVFIAGLSPAVWLIDHIAALVAGHTPTNLASYTTDVTTVIDVGVITPAALLASTLLRRRRPMGYLLSSTLQILLILVGLIVVGQSVMQILDGIVLTAGEIAAFVAPFVTLSLIAVWLTVVFLRNVGEPAMH
ncbi:MAG: hypothetical protein JXC32_12740 [Anaerolineae bacterium]|nr:hypothetical protein [Anaerolineae bacterium]